MDMIYPGTGMSVVDILEHVGVRVDFPPAQTCCGQPAFNSGYRDEARTVAKHFFKAFKRRRGHRLPVRLLRHHAAA